MDEEAVRIVEVGPRDGLQNISDHVPTEDKIELIRRLYSTGLATIELTSVVSPRAVPQLQDCRAVLASPGIQALIPDKTLQLPVLVPNTKGAEIALQHGITNISVFVSASEGFSKANTNRTVADGIAASRAVLDLVRDRNIAVRGYVSCIFEDPYDGPTPHEAVLRSVNALLEMGCYEVSLGDTLGTGSPRDVRELLTFLVINGVPIKRLAGHFHDTYGQALANVWEAYGCGVRVFDSSVAGLGGCPFAPGAKGNVASEDLVYMFQQAGVRTGVDLRGLVETGDWISRKLGKPNGSRAGTAMLAKQREASAREEKKKDGRARQQPNPLTRRTSEPAAISKRTRSQDSRSTSRVARRGSSGAAAQKGIANSIAVPKLEGNEMTMRTVECATNAQYSGLMWLLKAIDQAPPHITMSYAGRPAFGEGKAGRFGGDLPVLPPSATSR